MTTKKSIKEEVIESVVNTEVETTVRKKRVDVSRDLEVVFMNNCNGGYIYIDPRSQNRYEMTEYGDTDYITVGELLTMKNSHKVHLEKFWIYLLDVVSDTVEIDDVIHYLGLDNVYKNALSPEEIDNLLLKVNDDKFAKLLESMSNIMAQKVVERAIILFKEGKFDSFAKIDAIQTKVNNLDLFKDIKNTLED